MDGSSLPTPRTLGVHQRYLRTSDVIKEGVQALPVLA